MLEWTAVATLLAAMASDQSSDVDERFGPSAVFPLLSYRLKADEYWSGSGERCQMRPWSTEDQKLRERQIKAGRLPFMYFVSGSNRPPHIRGMWRIGHNVGVTASEVAKDSIEELRAMGHMTALLDVFIDSGAFEEFTHPQKISNLENRITKLEEEERSLGLSAKKKKTLDNAYRKLERLKIQDKEPDWLGEGRRGMPMRPVIPLYEDLVGSLGEWLHVVAPDKIGDQEETLARMRRYGDRMVQLARDDAEVLVPLQWGAGRSLAEFEEAALQAMGVPADLLYNFVPAMPLKASPLPWEDVLDYVRTWKPRRLHLLGVGPKRRANAKLGQPSGKEMIAQIMSISPRTQISIDAALIPAVTGKTSGPGKGMRQLERARHVLAQAGFSPTELQEMAMVVAWPDKYLFAMNEAGHTNVARRLPGPTPELPVDTFVAQWVQQLEDAGMDEAAKLFVSQIREERARYDELQRRRQETLENIRSSRTWSSDEEIK